MKRAHRIPIGEASERTGVKAPTIRYYEQIRNFPSALCSISIETTCRTIAEKSCASTAQTDRETELKGRRLGADDYITKPIDFDILVMIINARLAGVERAEGRSKPVTPSDREVETLTRAARGRTSIEIAQILDTTQAHG
jgi:DNA-binding response OmpR family regulator